MTNALTYGQYVRMKGWDVMDAATVFTVEGYAKRVGKCPMEAVERAVKNGHELASTINVGTVLTDSPDYYERENAEKAQAVVLTPGQLVTIEGRQYTVKPMGKRFSDPIHFIAA